MARYRHTNLGYLKEISNGHQEFIDDMIRVFSSSAPRMVAEMEVFFREKNWAGIKMVAHKLKPGIAFMGISELKQDILDIEESAARQQNLDQLPELISRLRVIILLSIEELKT